MEKLQELIDVLLDHSYKMSILKRNSAIKKKNSIIDSLVASVVMSKTSYEDVIECINDVNSGKVIDLSFLEKGGDIDNYISPKWINLAKTIWRQRPVGLGTPNAASGEGELMFIFLSPDANKPPKGDLKINNTEVELKGEFVRVSGKISGKEFRIRTLEISNKFGLTPNKSKKSNLDAVEIEKKKHQLYWKGELSKLSLDKQKQFVSEYLSVIDGLEKNVDHLFTTELNFETLVKEIVKRLYGIMTLDKSFDKFVLLGDGKNIKVLSRDTEEFNRKVDSGEINIGSDFFRVNQDSYSIGWYIS